MDGSQPIRLDQERARRSQGLYVVETSPAGRHFPPVDALDREPAPAFVVDRRAGCVIWTLTGLRLREADDFRQLGNLFLTNGWPRNFNALGDAELALSEPPPEAA